MGIQSNCRPRKKKKLMKESEFNNGDLISKLPDPLLHHIFSFLDMKFVIQTCVLSRRWRDLWISQPIMNFDEEVYNPSKYSHDHLAYRFDSDNSKYKYFTTFVETALFLHSTSKIHTFRLKCKDERQGMTVRLDDWMPILDRRKVEVLDLQIEMTNDHSILELPESFFKCRSLTTLKLDFGPKNDYGFLKIVEDEEYDIKSSLTRLKTIHLTSIWLLGGIRDLISMCRNLETLVISNCSLDMVSELKFYHFQLKHLVLESNEHYRSRIIVSASNLTSFTCRDYPINDYSFDSTYSLVEADIDTDYYMTNSVFEWSHSRNMTKCLRELHKVRSLKLSAWLLQLAYEFPDNEFNLPCDRFCNLRFLTLKTSLSISQIWATTNLLERCPQLETLVLKMTEPPLLKRAGEEENNWEAKLVPKCMMYQLKFVEIWNVQASVNELEFLKFLMKNATMLERLVVLTSHEQSSNVDYVGELIRFGEKLRSFEGISSRITIFFF